MLSEFITSPIHSSSLSQSVMDGFPFLPTYPSHRYETIRQKNSYFSTVRQSLYETFYAL